MDGPEDHRVLREKELAVRVTPVSNLQGELLEREVKRKVSALLALAMEHGPLYVWMPVVTAYGKRGLDYICCVNGQFVSIETKRPDEWLRPKQREIARDMCASGGKVFVISGPVGLAALEHYLELRFPSFGSTGARADPRRARCRW
jgi:hypothetical protein